MEDIKLQYELAFSALFHDIGKFAQRAHGGKEDHISPKAKTMEGQILPPDKDGKYGYRHALWTYDFFLEEFIPHLAGKLRNELNWERVASSSAAHHCPSSGELSAFVAEADRTSAGYDRKYIETLSRGEYLVTPERPIFTLVQLDNKSSGGTKSKFMYPMMPLSQSGAMFPVEGKELKTDEYKKQYDRFLRSLHTAMESIRSLDVLLAKCKDLLYEYTWCIPSATNDYYNDISLYDHSITTMAIALALLNAEDKASPLCICAVSVVGIQSFIFQTKNDSFKEAAKLFRGRSFIVSAMTTAYKQALCAELGLIPFVDCIDAGGKLTMLLPNFEGIEDRINQFQTKVEKFLLHKYYGTLAVNVDYSIKGPLKLLDKDNFKNTLEDIGFELNKKKYRKFSRALDSDYVFNKIELTGKVCSACGMNSVQSEDDEKKCLTCESQIRLGRELPSAGYIVFSKDKQSSICELLPNLYLSLVSKEDEPISGNIFSLNDHDETYQAWRLNMYVPEDNTFEDIARSAVFEDSTGKPFLGYLKLDVDNLGRIFEEGLTKSEGKEIGEMTISRYVSLSRCLHYFFNVYVHDLLEKEYPSTYTVISGGDDVFVILPWNQAIELTARLKKEFSKFCCDNSDLHFSAGIVVADDHEPFAFANTRANEALDLQAKGVKGKDSLSYFGVCFTKQQTETFLSEYKELSSYVSRTPKDGKPLSSGFIYRLYSYVNDALCEDDTKLGKSRRYGAYSKLRYDLARNVLANGNADQKCREQVTNFILNHFDNFNTSDDLKRFRVLLIHTMYNFRKTDSRTEE